MSTKQSHNRIVSRRKFLRNAGPIALGLSFIPMGACESLLVEPVISTTNTFPFLTPTETFFTQFGADGAIADWPGIQQIPRGRWRLTIGGLVSNPLSLSFSDIDSRIEAQRTILSTLRCILDNNAVPGLVGTATWTGVPLSLFLDEAGLDRSASRIRIYAADGFTNNLTLDKIYNVQSDISEPLLVYAMNGSPLRPQHGSPVRLLVPGHYGYKSVKWIEHIEVTTNNEVFGTYQEQLGYDDDGVIDVNAKVTNLLRGARIKPGQTRISGFALSGAAGIDRVLVSINDKPAKEARILSLNELVVSEPNLSGISQLVEDQFDYPYRGVWSLWELNWDATPGEHRISINAIDSAGHQQPLEDSDPTDGQNPAIEINVFVES